MLKPMIDQKNPQFLTLQLTHGVHGDNERHKYSRPITLSKQQYIANAQCDFSFITASNCVTFLKIRMHIGDRISYFCNRKISAIQTKHNSWLNTQHDHFVRDQSCTDPERRLGGGGGGRWPELTLKITSSIGNKQLSSTRTPGKCWTPFGTKKVQFSLILTVDPTVNMLWTMNPL